MRKIFQINRVLNRTSNFLFINFFRYNYKAARDEEKRKQIAFKRKEILNSIKNNELEFGYEIETCHIIPDDDCDNDIQIRNLANNDNQDIYYNQYHQFANENPQQAPIKDKSLSFGTPNCKNNSFRKGRSSFNVLCGNSSNNNSNNKGNMGTNGADGMNNRSFLGDMRDSITPSKKSEESPYFKYRNQNKSPGSNDKHSPNFLVEKVALNEQGANFVSFNENENNFQNGLAMANNGSFPGNQQMPNNNDVSSISSNSNHSKHNFNNKESIQNKTNVFPFRTGHIMSFQQQSQQSPVKKQADYYNNDSNLSNSQKFQRDNQQTINNNNFNIIEEEEEERRSSVKEYVDPQQQQHPIANTQKNDEDQTQSNVIVNPNNTNQIYQMNSHNQSNESINVEEEEDLDDVIERISLKNQKNREKYFKKNNNDDIYMDSLCMKENSNGGYTQLMSNGGQVGGEVLTNGGIGQGQKSDSLRKKLRENSLGMNNGGAGSKSSGNGSKSNRQSLTQNQYQNLLVKNKPKINLLRKEDLLTNFTPRNMNIGGGTFNGVNNNNTKKSSDSTHNQKPGSSQKTKNSSEKKKRGASSKRQSQNNSNSKESCSKDSQQNSKVATINVDLRSALDMARNTVEMAKNHLSSNANNNNKSISRKSSSKKNSDESDGNCEDQLYNNQHPNEYGNEDEVDISNLNLIKQNTTKAVLTIPESKKRRIFSNFMGSARPVFQQQQQQQQQQNPLMKNCLTERSGIKHTRDNTYNFNNTQTGSNSYLRNFQKKRNTPDDHSNNHEESDKQNNDKNITKRPQMSFGQQRKSDVVLGNPKNIDCNGDDEDVWANKLQKPNFFHKENNYVSKSKNLPGFYKNANNGIGGNVAIGQMQKHQGDTESNDDENEIQNQNDQDENFEKGHDYQQPNKVTTLDDYINKNFGTSKEDNDNDENEQDNCENIHALNAQNTKNLEKLMNGNKSHVFEKDYNNLNWNKDMIPKHRRNHCTVSADNNFISNTLSNARSTLTTLNGNNSSSGNFQNQQLSGNVSKRSYPLNFENIIDSVQKDETHLGLSSTRSSDKNLMIGSNSEAVSDPNHGSQSQQLMFNKKMISNNFGMKESSNEQNLAWNEYKTNGQISSNKNLLPNQQNSSSSSIKRTARNHGSINDKMLNNMLANQNKQQHQQLPINETQNPINTNFKENFSRTSRGKPMSINLRPGAQDDYEQNCNKENTQGYMYNTMDFNNRDGQHQQQRSPNMSNNQDSVANSNRNSNKVLNVKIDIANLSNKVASNINRNQTQTHQKNAQSGYNRFM